MTRYEFKVVPAPTRGEKSRAAKTTSERFALALTNLMNELGREGWDYVRADTLPVDERAGFTGTKTSFQNMLVFRRVIEAGHEFGRDSGRDSGSGVLSAAEPVLAPGPRLGAAEYPEGLAPALGPANPRLAAE